MAKYTVRVGNKTIRITSDYLDLIIEEHYRIITSRYKELLDCMLEDRDYDRQLINHKNRISGMRYANGKLNIYSEVTEWVSNTTAKSSSNCIIPRDEAIEIFKLIILESYQRQ